MSKMLLIESGPFETRVAVLEEGRLGEVQIERRRQNEVAGNVYKGRVARVLPGIQAAFVDIGLKRDAFLFAGDLLAPSSDDSVETQDAERLSSPLPIEAGVKEGDEILVQVVKEPLPNKGARITTRISLPGRFLVLLPGSEELGISRRIESESSRRDLTRQLEELRPEGAGLIARTAALGRSRAEFERDLAALEARRAALYERSAGVRPPALIEREPSLAVRALRDIVDRDCEAIRVEGADAWEQLVAYAEQVEPGLLDLLELHTDELPLFDGFEIDRQITKATERRVWLRSGGCIVIDPTEALVAIDVNSSRSTGGQELEQTALETNLEAAREIVRQMRLRDLTGIIVVDFIDMLEAEHRRRVVAVLAEELVRDRSRSQISDMSDFGLVAITRKRTRGGLAQQLTEPCPCCRGSGRIKDALSVGLELDRALRRRPRPSGSGVVRVRIHPRLRDALEQQHEELWRAILDRANGTIELVATEDLGLEAFEISAEGTNA